MNDKWEGNLKTLSKAKILISQLQDFWNFFIWTYLVLGLKGKYYAYIIVDDFSRFSWLIFLAIKMKLLYIVHILYKVQNEKKKVLSLLVLEVIMVENLKFYDFETFCNKHGIEHDFSLPRTPQQNGVVEGMKFYKKKKMVKTNLNENNLLKYF